MPSVVSLQRQEYYGFAHNRFWNIMGTYFQTSFEDYESKKQCMEKHGVAIWDVIATCEREGSLDSAIRNVVVNDVISFLDQHPSIECILCNGKKSFELFERHFKTQIAVPVVCLPSTSNANRTIKEEVLFATWLKQLHFIFK